jgi:hypothetical protein
MDDTEKTPLNVIESLRFSFLNSIVQFHWPRMDRLAIDIGQLYCPWPTKLNELNELNSALPAGLTWARIHLLILKD